MSSSYTKTRIMVECALMIALGTILANIKIYELPNGGSITLFSMVPSVSNKIKGLMPYSSSIDAMPILYHQTT